MHRTPLLEENEDCPFGNFVGQGLACAFSRRPSGNMSLSCGDTRGSLNNRKNFLQLLGINYWDLVCAEQAHGAEVRYITEKEKGSGALSCDNSIPATDGLITDKKNLPLAIFTADCLSLFLYDPLRPAIGLVHAGWRSSRGNIASKAVRLMQEFSGTPAANLYAAFGPAIRGCCYEVGEEFRNYFPQDLIEKGGRYYLDLAGVNRKQLLGAGLEEGNIFDSQICTSCRSEDFFSFRREGSSCARMMCVMMLK